MIVISDTKHPIKAWTNSIEPEAEKQLRDVASLPFIYKHVAVMPDVHAGKGSTVGTVIATKGAILPSCVGVDIGCGMRAIRLPFKIDVIGGDAKLKELRNAIERDIPVGKNSNVNISSGAVALWSKLIDGYPEKRDLLHALHQLGTLGGGNHFIEICRDQNNDAWVMLHSGSRNIGKTLAEVHIDKAKGLMRQYFIDVPHPDLAYLAQGTPEFQAYIDDLLWCQNYASCNRSEMMDRVLRIIGRHVGKLGEDYSYGFQVDCHHNYTSMEHHFGENVWVTRKGAVSAQAGQYGIIPGSMGVKSYIVRGLGNPESFNSCSHGAGRRMSRKKAKEQFNEVDLANQTMGVECRKDAGVVDEIPSAYKDIDEVMSNQASLVEPVYELKQILCVKG